MMDKKQQEEVETLGFDDDVEGINEDAEMLDFEADKEVSNQIEEMLDFIDIPDKTPKNPEESTQLDNLLEHVSSEKSMEIEASQEKLDEYKPSIKDFNIKSAKTRKIVHKAMLYVIILMLIGFEFFITRTGDTLNNLRVYASDNQPIRIVQNEKYGYIDYTGKKIANPKYSYGENFVRGYAIVKDSSNLPLIIDKGGKVVAPTGTYFSIYRAGEDIIASKVTKSGLKYGILSADLEEKAKFEYDTISYLNPVYAYSKGNEVGIINQEGKEIYKYKLTDSDDKSIDFKASIVNEDVTAYGVVKVNSSSQIINMEDGSVVSSPTLNEITPEENNVFYETNSDGSKKYMYVQNNKVLVESDDYTSLSIHSVKAGVLKAINSDYEYEFISTKSLEQLNKGLLVDDAFEGENVFCYNVHNYRRNTNSVVMVKNGEVFKTIDDSFRMYKGFNNGIAIVTFSDGSFGYLNENGSLISEDRYVEAGEFDEYGDAIAKKESGYGVINKNGKIIIDFKNENVKMAPSNAKMNTVANSQNVFYAVREDNKYALYNSKGKRVNKTFYNDVEFNSSYGVIKTSTDLDDLLITTESMSEINLASFKMDYEAHDNYIILKNEYYNYDGKVIYVDNGKNESEGVLNEWFSNDRCFWR